MPVNFGTPAASAAPVPAPAVAPAGAPVVCLGKAERGVKIDLTKKFPGLKDLYIPLSWDKKAFDTGEEHDLDISAFMLHSGGKCIRADDFVFYNMGDENDPNRMIHPTGCMEHSEDCTDGNKEGDDEWLKIHFDKVPADVERIAITVSIHEAEERRQNFGQVKNAVAKLFDPSTNTYMDCELSEDYSSETAIVLMELYRHNGSWKMDPVKSGFQGGLPALCVHYGFAV